MKQHRVTEKVIINYYNPIINSFSSLYKILSHRFFFHGVVKKKKKKNKRATTKFSFIFGQPRGEIRDLINRGEEGGSSQFYSSRHDWISDAAFFTVADKTTIRIRDIGSVETWWERRENLSPTRENNVGRGISGTSRSKVGQA